MRVIDFFNAIELSPDEIMNEFVKEVQEEIGGMGKMMTITPLTAEDRRRAKTKRNKDDATASMVSFEKRILELIPTLWAATRNTDTNITEDEIVEPVNHKQMLPALMAVPTKSFIKTTFNRRAWLKNEVYRSNVNFEGYAHWNAAVFYYIARRKIKMNDDDVNLVLRVIPFNESIAYRSIFAPRSLDIKGTGHHSSELSPEKYMEFLVRFISELSHEIICHRQATGRRYSARDVSAGGSDDETQKITNKILEIYERCREAAIKTAKFKETGM